MRDKIEQARRKRLIASIKAMHAEGYPVLFVAELYAVAITVVRYHTNPALQARQQARGARGRLKDGARLRPCRICDGSGHYAKRCPRVDLIARDEFDRSG